MSKTKNYPSLKDLRDIQKYYKNKNKINPTVLKNLRNKGLIIYGARSLNAVLPRWLDKDTEDYDVFSKTPQKSARLIEKALDKKFGKDWFKVVPALHPGTFKVKSKVTHKGIADFTKTPLKVGIIRKGRYAYADLKYAKQQIKKSLADPNSSYRHDKDKEALQRILIYEKILKKHAQKKA